MTTTPNNRNTYRRVNPMKTAPKDGTPILLHTPAHGWVVGQWGDLTHQGTKGWRLVGSDFYTIIRDPSSWSHVPPARTDYQARKVAGVWEGIDWSKSDNQLATELGLTRQAINYQRGRWAPETKHVLRKILPQSVWKAVDWSKPNKQIARELGVSNTATFNARCKWGKRKEVES